MRVAGMMTFVSRTTLMQSHGVFHRARPRPLPDYFANLLRRDALRACLDLVRERADALAHARPPDLAGVDVEPERLAEQL
jgi:hypothetical protein